MSTSPPTLIRNSLRWAVTPASWTGCATTTASTSSSKPGLAANTAATSPAWHTPRDSPRASPGCEPEPPVCCRDLPPAPRLGQFRRENRRGAHPPGVGDELGQPAWIHLGQPHHHQRPAVVAGRAEEQVRFAEDEGLLLRFVSHIQDGNVGPDYPPPARLVLRVGPDEALAADPEVEAVTVDLLHMRQRQREAPHVILVSHPDASFAECSYAPTG